jgi:transcriptional regulator of aromatic amino acid metabolism
MGLLFLNFFFEMSYPIFNASKYMSAEDVKNVAKLIVDYIVNKAKEQNHALNYDEIMKVLNTFWWDKNVRDLIIQGIYSACHSGNNN